MDVSECFPSKYLTAADLPDGETAVVMDAVMIEEMRDGAKARFAFHRCQKKHWC